MENKTNPLIIPLSIIIAGGLVALSIYFGGKNTQNVAVQPTTTNKANIVTGQVEPVTASDNIVGDINAKVVVVEYSDYECPFCKSFHKTMQQVMATYKPSEVAWVYRQFPIVQLHSRAPKESEAAFCVNELGGNKAFWQFTNRVFEVTTSNNTLDPKELPNIATFSGVDATAFNTCLSSGKYTSAVQNAVAAATKAGAQGTPYSVVLTKSGKKSSINGAEPFEQVKNTIDSLLK